MVAERMKGHGTGGGHRSYKAIVRNDQSLKNIFFFFPGEFQVARVGARDFSLCCKTSLGGSIGQQM